MLALTLLSVVHAVSASAVVDLGYAKYRGSPAENTTYGATAFLGIRYAAAPIGA